MTRAWDVVRFSPLLVLALLFAVPVIVTGEFAAVSTIAIVGAVVLQIVFLTAPRAARAAGSFVGTIKD